MVRNLVQIVTDRGGVRREFTHANPYSIVANGETRTLKIECHHLDERGKISGYHGAAYPLLDVREINFQEVNES